MTKAEFRARLKRIYPKAARGDQNAVQSLANLMKEHRDRHRTYGYCLDCGEPCKGKRCEMHAMIHKHRKKAIDGIRK